MLDRRQTATQAQNGIVCPKRISTLATCLQDEKTEVVSRDSQRIVPWTQNCPRPSHLGIR